MIIMEDREPRIHAGVGSVQKMGLSSSMQQAHLAPATLMRPEVWAVWQQDKKQHPASRMVLAEARSCA
ncbi:hypothetical protein [Roseobacter cerasinus]|uniref:hypothetical protein n=1 Tax=Roseobacter cerasinus TaxID=2602289 RepID=UPI0013578159|nr:hypothetical protein [Roseobacter cerasinus]